MSRRDEIARLRGELRGLKAAAIRAAADLVRVSRHDDPRRPERELIDRETAIEIAMRLKRHADATHEKERAP